MKSIALVLVGVVAGAAAGFAGSSKVYKDTPAQTTQIKDVDVTPEVTSPFTPVVNPLATTKTISTTVSNNTTELAATQSHYILPDTPVSDIIHYRDLAVYLQHIDSLDPQQLEALLGELKAVGHDATFAHTLGAAIYQRWAEQNLDAAIAHAIESLEDRQGYHSSMARNAITLLATLYPEAINNKVSELGKNDPHSELQYLAQQGLVSRDPEGFLRDLLESDNNSRDQQSMAMMALMTWSEKDAGAAWDFINTEYPDRFEFYERQNILGMWFEQDPDAALPEIEAALNSNSAHPEEHMMLVELYTRHLARDDPDAAMQWASSLPDARLREQAIMNLFYNQENMSADSMISFIDQLSAEDKQSILPMATYAIASNIARTDPQGAMAWAEQLPTAQRFEAQMSTLSEWTARDPDAAFDWIMALPDTPQNQELISVAAHPLIYSDPEAGKILFEKLTPQMQLNMIEPVVSALSQNSPEAVQQWLSEQSNPEVQRRGAIIVEIMNPNADTYSTLDKISALPEGNREEFFFRFLSERAYSDSDTVNQWLTETSSITSNQREMFQEMFNGMNGFGRYGGGGFTSSPMPTDIGPYGLEYNNEVISE